MNDLADRKAPVDEGSAFLGKKEPVVLRNPVERSAQTRPPTNFCGLPEGPGKSSRRTSAHSKPISGGQKVKGKRTTFVERLRQNSSPCEGGKGGRGGGGEGCTDERTQAIQPPNRLGRTEDRMAD